MPLEDRPIESLSYEEAQELIRRQRTHLATTLQIKPEPRNGIKRERDEKDFSNTPNKRRTVGESSSNEDADNEDGVEVVSVFTKNDRNKEIETIDLTEE